MRSKTFLAFTAIILTGGAAMAQKLPSKKNVLETLRLTNQYFMNKWPDRERVLLPIKKDPVIYGQEQCIMKGCWH
ncbi:hypothetical protein KRR40_33705 [Niabella defluvii]|nr:hypothetical protein KRR40_33705 [Niabella sp. I65]